MSGLDGYVLFVMRRPPVLSLALVCLFACADESEGDSSIATDSSNTTTMGTGAEGAESGSDFTPVPARGVRLTGVTANHGINVSIANGTAWAGPTEREGRLVSGRDTVIRVYHELDADWVEHEVEARLELTLPDGEKQDYSSRKILVTDTNDNYLDGGLWFAIPAETGGTAPGTLFEVSLWDVAPGGEGLTEHPNVAPADGPQQIGFELIPMEMNVHYIPFTWATNESTPDISPGGLIERVTEEIFQMQPLQAVNPTYGQPRVWQGGSNVCTMLETMQQVWASEGAPATTYYIGMLNTGATSGVMGCAWLNANVNADVWVEQDIDTTAFSTVHEIGHNQGLNHVECNDNGNPSAGNDPSYPDHPDGRTLNTGFGIRNFLMFPGDTTIDYMSYCTKRWVSPWTWAKIWPRIQSFTEASPLVSDPDPVMHFAMYPDGSTSWFTSLARLDPERGPDSARIDFERDGEVIARQLAQVDVLSDGESVWVTVPMPGGDHELEFDTVRYVDLASDAVHEARHDDVKFYTELDLGPQ